MNGNCNAEITFDGAPQCSAGEADERVPRSPGLYAIFVDTNQSLPPAFAEILGGRQTTLLYIGIATKSLFRRLVRQDLHHRSPSSFFRSIGVVCGHRPLKGSLRNGCNFQFSDNAAIVTWINEHVSVRWVCRSAGLAEAEIKAIRRYRPLLNVAHNPSRLPQLLRLRRECISLARGDDIMPPKLNK